MADLIDRQAALNCFPDWVDRHGDVHAADEDTVYQKIEALPSAQPEQLGTNLAEVGKDMINRQAACEYCHEDSEGYVRPLEKNCHAFIRFGMDGWELSLQAKGWHGSAKIRYCPMCGARMLRGETE